MIGGARRLCNGGAAPVSSCVGDAAHTCVARVTVTRLAKKVSSSPPPRQDRQGTYRAHRQASLDLMKVKTGHRTRDLRNRRLCLAWRCLRGPRACGGPWAAVRPSRRRWNLERSDVCGVRHRSRRHPRYYFRLLLLLLPHNGGSRTNLFWRFCWIVALPFENSPAPSILCIISN